MSNIFHTPTVYYSGLDYNAGSSNKNASVSEQMRYPLLSVASQYQAFLSKMRVPLSQIPLITNGNIPLKQWQVTLEEQGYTGSAFVRQINGSTQDFLFNCSADGSFQTYTYDLNGNLTLQSSLSLQPYVSQMFTDTFGNIYTTQSSTLNGLPTTLNIYNSSGDFLNSYTFSSIACATIDNSRNVYIAENEGDIARVKIYSNVYDSQAQTVTLSLIHTITTNFASSLLTNIATVMSDDGTIVIGYDNNKITIYNGAYQAQTDYKEAGITSFGQASNIVSADNVFCLSDIGTSTADVLYGGFSNQIYDAPTYTAQTSIAPSSGFVVVGSNAYCVNSTDSNVYVTPYPIGTAPVTPTLLTSDQPIAYISELGADLTALSTSNLFLAKNYNDYPSETASNTWTGLANSGGFNSPSAVLTSIDYNQNDLRLFATDGNNNLFRSNMPVYPMVYLSVDINNSYIYMNGIIKDELTPSNLVQNSISITPVNSLYQLCKPDQDISTHLFTVEGVPSAQQVIVRSMSDPSTVISTFSCTQNAGIISWMCVLQDYILCATGGTVNAYARADGAFVTSIITGLGDVNSIVQLDAITFCALGTNVFRIWRVSAPGVFTAISGVISCPVSGGMPSMCCNWADTVNGCSKLFISTGTGDSWTVTMYTFNTNYATVLASSTIYTTTITALGTISCNSSSGWLYIPEATLAIPDVRILYRSAGYAQANSATMSYGNVTMSQGVSTVDHIYTFVEITASGLASGNIQSVCTSKTVNNLLYVTSLDTNLVYSGQYNTGANTITFSQVASIPNTFNNISAVASNTAVSYVITNYNLQNQTLLSTYNVGTNIPVLGISRNTIKSQFIASLGKSTGNIVIFTDTDLTSNTVSTITGGNGGSIWSDNGEDINAQPTNIYNFQTIVDQINLAFLEAYARLGQALKNVSGITLLRDPLVLDYNYTNGLCTLTYSNDYPLLGNAVIFNTALLQVLNFYNLNGSLLLPLGSMSLTQTAPSLIVMNSLDKIILISDTIYVNLSYQGNNVINRELSSTDIPTDAFFSGNQGQVLYSQPNPFRPYNLASNQPIINLSFRLNYQVKDGSQYPVPIQPNESWTFVMGFAMV